LRNPVRIDVCAQINLGIGHAYPQDASRLEQPMSLLHECEALLEREVLQHVLEEDRVDPHVGERKRTSKVPGEIDRVADQIDIHPTLLSHFLRSEAQEERTPAREGACLSPLTARDEAGRSEAGREAERLGNHLPSYSRDKGIRPLCSRKRRHESPPGPEARSKNGLRLGSERSASRTCCILGHVRGHARQQYCATR
jgi:hypothetical protein